MREEVEPRLRSLVAEALGVNLEQLAPETSLVQDLAADSLDVLDLVVRIEDEFDVTLPERELGAIETYADLTAATVALIACRLRTAEAASTPVAVRVGDGPVPRLVRVFGSDPYDQELLREDLRTMRASEPVDVSGRGDPALERALVRARFDGADVRTPDRPDEAPLDAGEDRDEAQSWPASRLVTRSLALVDELRGERETSLGRLAGRGIVSADELAVRRAATDELVVAFREVVEVYLDVLEDSRAILHAAARELGRLDLVRRAVDEHAMDLSEVRDAFDSIADALLCYVHALQSQIAWTRTRLPPRAMTPRPSRPETDGRNELRA